MQAFRSKGILLFAILLVVIFGLYFFQKSKFTDNPIRTDTSQDRAFPTGLTNTSADMSAGKLPYTFSTLKIISYNTEDTVGRSVLFENPVEPEILAIGISTTSQRKKVITGRVSGLSQLPGSKDLIVNLYDVKKGIELPSVRIGVQKSDYFPRSDVFTKLYVEDLVLLDQKKKDYQVLLDTPVKIGYTRLTEMIKELDGLKIQVRMKNGNLEYDDGKFLLAESVYLRRIKGKAAL